MWPITRRRCASTSVTVPSSLLPTNSTAWAPAPAGSASPPPTSAATSSALRPAALRMTRQAIVGDLLPSARVGDELAVAGPDAGVRVEGAEADAEGLGLVRVPAPQGGPQAGAECLRESGGRLVLADQLGALEHPERTRLDPSLRGRGRARPALAARAVAVARRTERAADLEPDASAHASARERDL